MNTVIAYLWTNVGNEESVNTQKFRISQLASVMGIKVVSYYIDRDPIEGYRNPGVNRLKAAVRKSLREGWPVLAESARQLKFDGGSALYEWFVKRGGRAWGASDEFGITDPAMREKLASFRVHRGRALINPDTPLDDAVFRLQFSKARDAGAANDSQIARYLTAQGFLTPGRSRGSRDRVGDTRRRLMTAEIAELHKRLVLETGSRKRNWLHRVGQSLGLTGSPLPRRFDSHEGSFGRPLAAESGDHGQAAGLHVVAVESQDLVEQACSVAKVNYDLTTLCVRRLWADLDRSHGDCAQKTLLLR